VNKKKGMWGPVKCLGGVKHSSMDSLGCWWLTERHT